MTVTSQTNQVEYLGDGLVDEWGFGFRVYSAEHVKVYVRPAGGTIFALVEDGYTVDLGAGDAFEGFDGGTVTLAVAEDATIRVARVVPYEQTGINLEPSSGFDPLAVERAFDLLVMMLQQVRGEAETSAAEQAQLYAGIAEAAAVLAQAAATAAEAAQDDIDATVAGLPTLTANDGRYLMLDGTNAPNPVTTLLAALGIVLQLSTMDTTANALMRVGAFGLGGNAPLHSTSLDDITITCLKRITSGTTDIERAANGLPYSGVSCQILTLAFSSTELVQLAFPNSSSGPLFAVRTRTGGSWRSWQLPGGVGRFRAITADTDAGLADIGHVIRVQTTTPLMITFTVALNSAPIGAEILIAMEAAGHATLTGEIEPSSAVIDKLNTIVRAVKQSNDKWRLFGADGGKTWISYTSIQRPANTWQFNDTGDDLKVLINFTDTETNRFQVAPSMSGAPGTAVDIGRAHGNHSADREMTVPPYHYYRVLSAVSTWHELRKT